MFKNIFNKNKEKNSNVNSIDLVDENQLEEIIKLSGQKNIIIFKHSTRCGISNMVLKRFESSIANKNIDYYLLDVLTYKNLSNLIADKFQVQHQSPQILVFKDEKVVARGSHYDILSVEIF